MHHEGQQGITVHYFVGSVWPIEDRISLLNRHAGWLGKQNTDLRWLSIREAGDQHTDSGTAETF